MKERILHSWLIFFNTAFFIIYLVITLTVAYKFSDFWLAFATYGGIALIFIHLALRRALGDRELLSIDKLFIASYAYFHYGYLLPYSLDAIPYQARVFWNPAMAPQAALMITTSLAGFLLGYNLRVRIVDIPDRLKIASNPETLKSTFLAGRTAMFSGLILILLFMGIFGVENLIYRQYGFDLFYSGEYDTGLFNIGKLFFGIGATIFSAEIWFQKRLSLSIILGVLAISIYSFIVFIFFGVRSWLMIDVFLPLILSFHYLYKKIPMSWGIALLISFLGGSLIMEIARPAAERSIGAFQEELTYQLSSGEYSAWDLTARQYHSYTRVIQEMSLVPLDRTYQFGSTLLYGLIGGIPELGKYLLPERYEAPERWMASIVEPWFYANNEGIGFSIVAESHINFGIVGGAFFLLLIGLVSGQLWLIVINRGSINAWLIYLIFTINLIFGVRQTVMGFVRPMIGLLFVLVFVQLSQVFLGKAKRSDKMVINRNVRI